MHIHIHLLPRRTGRWFVLFVFLLLAGTGRPAEKNNGQTNLLAQLSLSELTKRAGEGQAEAQLALGVRFMEGAGVRKDPQQSFDWIKKAAEQGLAKAQFQLVLYYDEEFHRFLTPAETHRWTLKAAEQGLMRAQITAGNQLSSGFGNKGGWEEIKSAFKWYKMAAESNDPDAITSLVVYLRMQPIPDRDAELVRWSKRAAELHLRESEFLMGELYRNGQGVPKDAQLAAEWYQKGAHRGELLAQYRLGFCYLEGKGMPQDYQLALQWFERSARQKHWGAAFQAGKLLWEGIHVKQDRARAETFLRPAAEAGDWNARLLLNLVPPDELARDQAQEKLEKDLQETEPLRQKASRGDVHAMVQVGRYHLTGEKSLELNWIEAYHWFDQAAQKGDAEAIEERAKLLEK